MVNRQRVLEEFYQLVKVNSATKEERDVAEIVKAKLTAIGMSVFEDNIATRINGNCGNVFGYLKGCVEAPVLLLSAHLDCVEPCRGVIPKLVNGIITSSGDTVLGADDKAGIVGILEALRVIQENNVQHGDIQVIFTVGEEGALTGSKHIEPDLIKADLGYVLDTGGTPGRIINAAPGQNNVRIAILGKSAHAGSAPEDGINAIIVAGKALVKLKQGRIDFETTANVGIIRGGLATNIVPNYTEILCEVRSHNLEKLQNQTNDIINIFESTAVNNGASIEFEVTKIYEPYQLADDSPVVMVAKQAAQNIGLTNRIDVTGGGSDANFFNIYGVPTAVLGTGMSKVHTTEEFIKVEDLMKTPEFVVSVIQTAAGVQ